MIFESRSDSRAVVIDGKLNAFRDVFGVWTADPPPLLIEDLAAEFREVTDSDRASMLVNEAKTALSL